MNDILIGFTMGFCLATILIVRASIRPKIKRHLRPILGMNKAKIPRVKVKTKNFADQEI